MRVKDVVAEDFCNYKEPSMFIVSAVCDWKCCIEQGIDIGVCQNAPLASQKTVEIDNSDIYELFHNNDITSAIVIGGLEPMLQIEEVIDLITYFRSHGDNSTFVIYTGYYPEEIPLSIEKLRSLDNIIVKFGRYIPDSNSRYDDVLGVTLASENQYARELRRAI